MVHSQLTLRPRPNAFGDLGYLNTLTKTEERIESAGAFATVSESKGRAEATVASLDAVHKHLLRSYEAASSRVILFNSTGGHDQSTKCLFEFAKFLSNHDAGRVVSIDCNFASRQLHSCFDATRAKGLTDYISDSASMAEIIGETSLDDVSFIRSGSPHFTPLKLFMSSKFLSLVSILQREFDFILLNSPPYHTCVDAFVLAKFLRPTVLLIPDTSNRHDDAADVYDELGVLKLDVLVYKMP